MEAVGYHGEMDVPSRRESYTKWKSGQVQTIVATKAFGMGIDKPDIRHVIRNGVPESILSWAQKLGRAGRDGNQACATILYRKLDISHANPWIMNNLHDRDRCNRILSSFSESWRYINAHLAGVCRRRLLTDMFGETNTPTSATGDCCDVCSQNWADKRDFKVELGIVIDTINHIGFKGEVKLAEWIRGSNIAWTAAYTKNCSSYGNHLGKDLHFWRTFIRQCHVISVLRLELKSMIKGSGMYAVNGIYHPTQKGTETVTKSDPLLLPIIYEKGTQSSKGVQSRMQARENSEIKKKRIGKGCNVLTIVRKLLSEPENWIEIENKRSYQFPGVSPKPSLQHLFYTDNLSNLQQSVKTLTSFETIYSFLKGSLTKTA